MAPNLGLYLICFFRVECVLFVSGFFFVCVLGAGNISAMHSIRRVLCISASFCAFHLNIWLFSWWEYSDNRPNRTIKTKRKWALHLVYLRVWFGYYVRKPSNRVLQHSVETEQKHENTSAKWQRERESERGSSTKLNQPFLMEWNESGTRLLLVVSLFFSAISLHLRVHSCQHQHGCPLFCNKNS